MNILIWNNLHKSNLHFHSTSAYKSESIRNPLNYIIICLLTVAQLAKSNKQLHIFIAFSLSLYPQSVNLQYKIYEYQILGNIFVENNNLEHIIYSYGFTIQLTVQQIVQQTCFEDESLAVSSCSIMESTSRSLVMVKVYFFLKHEKYSHPSKKIQNIL